MDRRKFISKSSRAAVASSLTASFGGSAMGIAPGNVKTKVALVGTGDRGSSAWGKNLVHPYGDYVEMVAMCDINHKRMAYAREYIGTDARMYKAEDFDLMIKETSPDIVIVTTTDCFHEKYIVRAMELGCDVISEKPVATESDQCQRIVDAEIRTGRKVLVGFNVRHMVESEEMKRIISSGELGKIISVDYQEYLDTSHGASYYRRWHGKKEFSGSLLLSKSCHHFDLVNWLLEDDPLDVQAVGKLAFYGSNNSFRGRNCRTCQQIEKCDFYWDITKSERAMSLYGNCEDVDGYLRDGCVWNNDNDSYDTCSVHVNYNNGTILTYTLNAFLPYEGQYICFSGEKGRLDVRLYYRQPWEVEATYELRLTKDRDTTRKWFLNPGQGGHGGADEKVKDMFFKPGVDDVLGKKAGSRAGVMSSLIGIAARTSIETGKKIKIGDLINIPTTWKG